MIHFRFFFNVYENDVYCYRSSVRYNLKGIQHMVEFLNRLLERGVNELDNDTAEFCCEALKIIFNLLLATEKPELVVEEEENHDNLMKIIRHILTVQSSSLDKREELKRSGNIFDYLKFELMGITNFLFQVMLSTC